MISYAEVYFVLELHVNIVCRNSVDPEDDGEEGDCPTCQAFSSSCCQGVQGARVFQDLQVLYCQGLPGSSGIILSGGQGLPGSSGIILSGGPGFSRIFRYSFYCQGVQGARVFQDLQVFYIRK